MKAKNRPPASTVGRTFRMNMTLEELRNFIMGTGRKADPMSEDQIKTLFPGGLSGCLSSADMAMLERKRRHKTFRLIQGRKQ